MSGSTRPTRRALAAWRGFLEVHAAVTEQLDRELREHHGFGLDWYDVLVQLHEAGGRRTMSDLADAVLVSRPNCTRRVDRLVRAGLVGREADAHDARVRWATLTDAGRNALREAAPTHLTGIQHHFARHFGPGEATMVGDMFDRITSSLPAESGEPR